jgi:hypothetical protein
MNGLGATARFLQRPLRGRLVKLLSDLLRRSNAGDADIRPRKVADPPLIDELIALGMFEPEVNGRDGPRLTRPGLHVVKEILHHGVEKVFRPRNVPMYDGGNMLLYWRGTVIKTWDREATSQNAVLAAFEEEDWPDMILDPIWPDLEQDAKERLRETVKRLNKGLKPGTIRFFTTRLGTAVRWAPVRGNKQKRKNPG